MKIAVICCAVICIAVAPVASAQSGGYPASPSHGVVGTKPDGTPRYGSEPDKNNTPSSDTVGRGGSNAPDQRAGVPVAKKPGEGPKGAGSDEDR